FSLAILPLGFPYDGHSTGSLATQSQSVQDANDLVESIRKGDLKGVERLLAAGVDVNAKSKDGETALVAAAGLSDGSDELVELLLLASGARVDDRSLGLSAIWVDTGLSLHQQPTRGLYCGEWVMFVLGSYSKRDRLGVTPLLAAAASGKSRI